MYQFALSQRLGAFFVFGGQKDHVENENAYRIQLRAADGTAASGGKIPCPQTDVKQKDFILCMGHSGTWCGCIPVRRRGKSLHCQRLYPDGTDPDDPFLLLLSPDGVECESCDEEKRPRP